ncbi:hypothetical protein YC2023_051094 [Brassica napus]
MALDACAPAPRAPHVRLHVQETCRTPPLLPHVMMHAWSACKKPHQYTHVDQHASVACAETPRAWSIHLVLLHVRLHVQLPCTATPQASGDTQIVRWLTPRSEPMQRATSSFSVASGFLEEFHNTEIRVFAQFRVFPSCFDPVVLASRPA